MANVDERDNRGHTPMDLAKLWGHRQCARTLAMEVWHQKKEFQAKELQYLQKLKMAEVLREIEIEEKLLFESQGLKKKEIKKSDEQNVKKQQTAAENQQSPYDPFAHKDRLNSKTGKVSKPNSRILKQQRKERPPSVKRPNLSSRQSGRSVVTDSSDTGLYERNQPSVENQPLEEGNLEDGCELGRTGFYNPNSWNPSTHIKPKDYLTDLADDYPRDEYTKLPRLRDLLRTPAYVASIREKAEKLGVDVDKLKDELMKEEKEKKWEKSVLHKPKNIEYSQTKRKYETPFALTSEAPFHLIGDSNSLLVRLNIIEERIPPTPSTTLSALSVNHVSDSDDIIREQRDRIAKSMPKRGQIGY
ncbi:unnamed protein product [Dimorphilus gyrociliatus]|nr:unnamed protein product [Dimorphilus gyrociliatus]